MMGKKRYFVFLVVLVQCIFGLNNSSYGGDFDSFVKELRNIFFSVQGKATLFGYTKEYGFAEVKEGSFKAGDMVAIRSLSGEELAFGEVEDIKSGLLRIYITSQTKPLKKDSEVVGLKRIYANIRTEGNGAVIKTLFLKEKDFIIQENRDEKTSVVLYFDKKDEHTYGYRAVTPSGRILLLGNISLNSVTLVGQYPQTISVAYDEDGGNIWIYRGKELLCHSCSSTEVIKPDFSGEVKAMFAGKKGVYLLTDKGSTFVIEGNNIHSRKGWITQGEELLFSPEEQRLYDLNGNTVKNLSQNLDMLFYWKEGVGLGKKGDKLFMIGDTILKELTVSDVSLLRVKNDKLYLYREIKEEVPLSGVYLAIYLEVYDLKGLFLLKRSELNEEFVDFDVDEKNGEVIGIKRDGTLKRFKF